MGRVRLTNGSPHGRACSSSRFPHHPPPSSPLSAPPSHLAMSMEVTPSSCSRLRVTRCRER